jgi:hypothetical protein
MTWPPNPLTRLKRPSKPLELGEPRQRFAIFSASADGVARIADGMIASTKTARPFRQRFNACE